ncbi:MAG TPA: HipA family kinase [Bryobacteraceae bacterium]|jgi:hypothetical protein
MRGASQAHLMQADDGQHYVVKINTPQNRRTLVNELLAGLFLEHLGFTTPQMALIQGKGDVLPPGKHFASRFPGDPKQTVVYDFVPDSVLRNVANLHEFAGMLVFDKWVGNDDFRQCVFTRTADAAGRSRFQALWIDNGNAFGGSAWQIAETPRKGLYLSSAAYKPVRGWSDFDPWLEAIRQFPEELVEQAIQLLPPEWAAHEADALRRMMDRLLLQRSKVAQAVERAIEQKPEAFPNWKQHPVSSAAVRKSPASYQLAASSQVA